MRGGVTETGELVTCAVCDANVGYHALNSMRNGGQRRAACSELAPRVPLETLNESHVASTTGPTTGRANYRQR